MNLHLSSGGRHQLRGDQLHELVQIHRQYGLVLRCQHAPDAAAALDANPLALVTEILRLATIGVSAERMIAAGVDGVVSDLINDLGILWDARVKP